MDQLDKIKGHIKELENEVNSLIQLRDAHNHMIDEINILVRELSTNASLNSLKDVSLLKQNYLDRILALVNPKNFTQLVLETSIPGIYEPPVLRSKKGATIKSIVAEIQDQKAEKKKNPKKVVGLLKGGKGNTPYPDFATDELQRCPPPPVVAETEKKTESKDKEEAMSNSTHDLEFKVRERTTSAGSVSLTEPEELFPLEIAGERYYFNPQTAKIYQAEKDSNIGVLVAQLSNGCITIDGKQHRIGVEDCVKLVDSETQQCYYRSLKKKNTYYEALNEDNDGWLISLERG